MDIDETKQVKLKDKPMMTLLEAAEFTGIGRQSFVSYQINQIVSLFFGLAISDCSKETNCLNIS